MKNTNTYRNATILTIITAILVSPIVINEAFALIINEDLTVNKDLIVKVDLIVNEDLTVFKDAQIDGNAIIDGYANIYQYLQVNGVTQLDKDLIVDGNTFLNQNITVKGTTVLAGHLWASAITQYSSEKWKTNISPLDDPLAKILQVNGVTYDWKVAEFPEKHFTDESQIGFIAEDLEKIYPELVVTAENGDKSVRYSKLSAILVEAIKEQQQTIEMQENRLTELSMAICDINPQSNICQDNQLSLHNNEGVILYERNLQMTDKVNP